MALGIEDYRNSHAYQFLLYNKSAEIYQLKTANTYYFMVI